VLEVEFNTAGKIIVMTCVWRLIDRAIRGRHTVTKLEYYGVGRIDILGVGRIELPFPVIGGDKYACLLEKIRGTHIRRFFRPKIEAALTGGGGGVHAGRPGVRLGAACWVYPSS
jgi:hypothetical protein